LVREKKFNFDFFKAKKAKADLYINQSKTLVIYKNNLLLKNNITFAQKLQ